MSLLVVGLIVGVVVGFYVGRWRAEVGAAWHSGSQAMKRRRAYRGK